MGYEIKDEVGEESLGEEKQSGNQGLFWAVHGYSAPPLQAASRPREPSPPLS